MQAAFYDNALEKIKDTRYINNYLEILKNPDDAIKLPLTMIMLGKWKIEEAKKYFVKYLDAKEIYVNIKSLGKKKKALTPMEYEISENISTLKEFLIEMVKIEVEKYNEKGTEVQSIFVFSNKEIEELAEVGKVGFGRVYSDKKADLQQAIENVLQCYKDGLVRVFQNDMELVDLEETIQLKEGDIFTFMRLTFLAGRMW